MFELVKTGLLIALFMGLAGTYSCAYGLRNPMRPPRGYLAPKFVPRVAVETTDGSVLQSVIVGRGRSTAIIDGVAVSPGEWYQGAQLISVKTDEVVLKKQNGKKIVLKLTPGINKKKVSAATEMNLK